MTLVDANLLLYARDSESSHHEAARSWLSDRLNGAVRVGLPWASLLAFLRIATHPRAYERPLSPAAALEQIDAWLQAPAAWIPSPTARHSELLGELIIEHELRGKLVPDADLAALALEHGLIVYSADTDFARFQDRVRWIDPLR